MVATALLILNAFIFLVIAAFHFYWAFGGQFAANAVLPELPNKQKVFVPGKVATFIVALLFLGTSALFTGLGFGYLPQLFRGFLCVVAVVTLLRAIGDFRYVGFFQKRSQSRFSHNDLRYYSPLCLLISVFSVLPLWLQHV